MLTEEKVKEALKELREKAKKRNFLESVELAISFKNIDFKKPENRIELEVVLPKGRGKEVKIGLFADKNFAAEVKKTGIVDGVFTKDDIEKMDKKTAKKIAKEYKYFVAEPTVMALIGKKLGTVLGPRRKMPRPVPPNVKALENVVKNLRNTVVLSNKKGKYMPVVHAPVGTVEMKDEDIVENVMAVYGAVVRKLPSGDQNVKSVYLKTTMGPAVKVV